MKIKSWNVHIKNAFGFQFNINTGRSSKKILKRFIDVEKNWVKNSFWKKKRSCEGDTQKRRSLQLPLIENQYCVLSLKFSLRTHISSVGGAQWILLLTIWTTNVHSLDKNYSLVASYCYDTMIKRRKMSRIVNTFKKKVISSDRQQEW